MVKFGKTDFKLADVCTASHCGEKSVTRVIEHTTQKRHDLCHTHNDALQTVAPDKTYEVIVYWDAKTRSLRTANERKAS